VPGADRAEADAGQAEQRGVQRDPAD